MGRGANNDQIQFTQRLRKSKAFGQFLLYVSASGAPPHWSTATTSPPPPAMTTTASRHARQPEQAMTATTARRSRNLPSQPGVSCAIGIRVPPEYGRLLDDIAAEIGQSKAALFRRSVEHYLRDCCPEADQELVEQLIAAGRQVRDRPHPSARWIPPNTQED
jgi:predicted DNA-binding protein